MCFSSAQFYLKHVFKKYPVINNNFECIKKKATTSNFFKVILSGHIANTVDVIPNGMVRCGKRVTCADKISDVFLLTITFSFDYKITVRRKPYTSPHNIKQGFPKNLFLLQFWTHIISLITSILETKQPVTPSTG